MSCFGFKSNKKKEQLPQSKTVYKPTGKSQIFNPKQYDDFKLSMQKIKKTPNKQDVNSRDEDYAVVTNKIQPSKVYVSRQQLNFKMDEQNGIAQKLQINHFVYDSLVQGKYGLSNNKAFEIKLQKEKQEKQEQDQATLSF